MARSIAYLLLASPCQALEGAGVAFESAGQNTSTAAWIWNGAKSELVPQSAILHSIIHCADI